MCAQRYDVFNLLTVDGLFTLRQSDGLHSSGENAVSVLIRSGEAPQHGPDRHRQSAFRYQLLVSCHSTRIRLPAQNFTVEGLDNRLVTAVLGTFRLDGSVTLRLGFQVRNPCDLVGTCLPSSDTSTRW